MQIPVIACTLVGLMLLHKGEKLLSRPTFCLEIVIVRGRRSGVHLSDVSSDLEYIWLSEITIKLIELPPPRMFAHGTIARRPSRCSDGREW